MSLRSGILVVLFVFSVATGATASGALGASAGDYEITISESVDVPDRTITVEGENFTISSVADRDPGDDLTVSVEAPSGASYALHLRNADNQMIGLELMSGSGNATFGADAFSGSGLYYVAVSDGGSIEAIHPVVVEAYEVTADVPGTAESNETIRVTATLTEQEERNISTVTAIVANQNATHSARMTESGGEYAANVSLSGLDPDSYLAYVVVRGEEEANGEKVPIGLSGEHTLNVTPCVNGIVAGSDGRVGLTEIQTAIHWWASDQPVPGTDGWKIDLTRIQSLINAWAGNTPVDCQ